MHFGLLLHFCSSRLLKSGQVADAYQVLGGASQGKHPVHFRDATMANLAHPRDRSYPTDLARSMRYVVRK